MTAIQRFKDALHEYQIGENIIAQIFEGYENISDRARKERKAAFFVHAIERMENVLDSNLCHAIREACACSKGGWRLKAMQKIAREYQGENIERKLEAIGQVTCMGNPVLNENDTITAGIGHEGGFPCPCPIFQGVPGEQSISKTYCYCCAGHFRYHYQIALGKKLRTQDVVSSALESHRKEPCRFVFEIVE